MDPRPTEDSVNKTSFRQITHQSYHAMSPTVESTDAFSTEAASTLVKARSRTAILQYLSQWKYERDAWRFRKNVQSAMMRSIFDRGVVYVRGRECASSSNILISVFDFLNVKLPKKHFKLALAYLSTVKGASREVELGLCTFLILAHLYFTSIDNHAIIAPSC